MFGPIYKLEQFKLYLLTSTISPEEPESSDNTQIFPRT